MATFPVYVFDSRTGVLAVNVFGKHDLSARQLREIEEIARGLRADAEAGLLPDIRIGWPGVGFPPVDAVDIYGPEMAGWLARAYVVRIGVSDVRSTHDAADSPAYIEAGKGDA